MQKSCNHKFELQQICFYHYFTRVLCRNYERMNNLSKKRIQEQDNSSDKINQNYSMLIKLLREQREKNMKQNVIPNSFKIKFDKVELYG